MKEILLTQDKVALVDDEDYEWLNQWKWCTSKAKHIFYAVRRPSVNEEGTVFYMHRVILGFVKNDGRMSDHKDRNGLNNQRYNLQETTFLFNRINSRKQINNSSGFKGVTWHKRDKVWQATIHTYDKTEFCGYYSEITEAALAYDRAALRLWGENAILNFPNQIPRRSNENSSHCKI